MIFFEASYVQACNLKHPLISSYSSCFICIIAILYIVNDSFTKHPFETGGIRYQECYVSVPSNSTTVPNIPGF